MKITQTYYENAARAVHSAILDRRSKSNRRLHIDRYKKHAAPVLGVASVYPARWAAVLAAGERLGLFRVDRETLSKPIFADVCKITDVAKNPAETKAAVQAEEPRRVRLDLGLGGVGESLNFVSRVTKSDEDAIDEDTSDDPTEHGITSNANTTHTHAAIMVRHKSKDKLIGAWFSDGVFKLTNPKLFKRYAQWAQNPHYEVQLAYFTPFSEGA